MAGAKGKNEQIVTLAKLRDQAVVIAQEIRLGKITPNAGNAVLNGYRTAAYIEQVRLAKESDELAQVTKAEGLSRADKARLDNLAKLLSEDKEG